MMINQKIISINNKITHAINRRIDQGISKLLLNIRQKTKPQVISIKNIQIPIPESITSQPLKYIYAGQYEQEELYLLQRYLEKDDVVMEIGTGLGFLASYCSIELGSDQVSTYEANPNLKQCIEKTFSLNQVNPNLNICMLGETEGEETFYLNQDFWSSSTIPRKNDQQAIKIPVIPFQRELDKVKPTLLLIDIEGGEYELLKSANLYGVKKIIMEIHIRLLGRTKTDYLMETLKDKGFSLVEVTPRGYEFFFQRA